ncbi:hypothetical protein CJF30_00009596 [Rutstroemia sp. NJR-2017a BBW]|nr:hypothetical protein CJF30_00009596 [Rutstroemia sp. NJR-2017a BBW]
MKGFLTSIAVAAGLLKAGVQAQCPDYSQYSQQQHPPLSSGKYALSYMRPDPACRTFNSSIVESVIANMSSVIKDPDLYRLFQNSFPNTLDTAVKWKGYSANNSEEELTFLITGDIDAMWLRDSANQMQSYVTLLTASSSPDSLASLFRGVINLQARYINSAPHCNSFQAPTESGIAPQQNQANPDNFYPAEPTSVVFECKYELDSLAAFLEISSDYYQATKDITFFQKFNWVSAVETIIATTEALLVGTYAANGSVNASPYTWQRQTTSATETLDNSGAGNPVQDGTGLVRSAFRPSDDALHPLGPFISSNRMDDANIPSLLSAPFFGYLSANDSVYQATRKFILSKNNPYFMRGPVINAVGGPHVGPGYAWPMAKIIQIFTSSDTSEITAALKELVSSTAGLGLIHESIYTFDQNRWTRQWFSWANGLFGQCLLDLRTRLPGVLAQSYQ